MSALWVEAPTDETMPLHGSDAVWRTAKHTHDLLGLPTRLRLVALGIPYDVAMALEGGELLAYAVAAGEAQGGEWDWERKRWRHPYAHGSGRR